VATYKLIQDIEAEDHILGPLTLRQFIFAIIAIFCFYICFIVATKGAAFLLVLFVPPGLFFGFFALPFGGDQPTEIWALAKLRFWFKPRRRIWDQSGVKELVTITVPKKVERVYSDGLSQTEVKSRLTALANTIDSRGWAVKNVNVSTYLSNRMAPANSERLLDISAVPQQVPEDTVSASEDILDERNNPIAQQFDAMINQSSQQHHQALVDQISRPAIAPSPSAQNNQWFMSASPLSTARPTTPPLPTYQPAAAQPDPAPVTAPADAAILSLANNNDLSVDTLAREARKAKGQEPDQGEVVISLR
jgi:hypothetical protein